MKKLLSLLFVLAILLPTATSVFAQSDGAGRTRSSEIQTTNHKKKKHHKKKHKVPGVVGYNFSPGESA